MWNGGMNPVAPRAPMVRMCLSELEDRTVADANFATAPVVPTIGESLTQNMHQIYLRGLEMGNRPNVVMKVGDSISANPQFLQGFGNPKLRLGGYDPRAAETIHMYRSLGLGDGSNSFNRNSYAAQPGFTVAHSLQTVDREIDTIRPSFAIVMIGTNDAVVHSTEQYRAGLEALVQKLIDRGVVPILQTIPNHFFANARFQAQAMANNQVIAETAEKFNVPLSNYWLSMQQLPNTGVSKDGVHPSDAGYAARSGATLNALTVVRLALGLTTRVPQSAL